MRRYFFLLAMIAACQPFDRGESTAGADQDIDVEEQPKKKKSDPSPSPPPSTETMPTEPSVVCEGAHFCDDFEASTAGTGVWEDFESSGFDVVSRTGPSAGTGAFSVGFFLAPDLPSPKSTSHPSIKRDLGQHDRVELSFALQIPKSFGATGHTNLAHLDFGGKPELVLTVVGEQDRIGLVILDDKRDYDLIDNIVAPSIAAGGWHQVKVSVDLPGNPPTATMTVDGQEVVTKETLFVPFDHKEPVRLTLGPDFKSTPDSFELRYDNVRVDVNDL